jgi:hypothetical protein
MAVSTLGISTAGVSLSGISAAGISQPVDPLTPSFEEQPESQTAAVGSTPVFSSSARVDRGSISYQWQQNSGGGFSNIVGATLRILTFLPVVIGQNGLQLRVTATANGKIVFSKTVILTVTL